MFCPKCGSETVSDARYCRTCGTDVSVVQRALTGQMSTGTSPMAAPPGAAEAPKLLEKSIKSATLGIGFIAVAFCSLIFAPAGHLWWFWMFIPAFAMIGSAIAEYVRYRTAIGASPLPTRTSAGLTGARAPDLPAGPYAEQLPPPSVTENTTRQLEHRETER
jgi:hypothetical protein